LPFGKLKQKFPLPVLERQQNVELLAFVSLGSSRRSHIKLFWDDDAGEPRRSRLVEALEMLTAFSDAFGISNYMHGSAER
jgi:hypothetical protein